MGRTSRVGSGLLLAGGLALVGLMAYTLALEDRHHYRNDHWESNVADVAVFFPDRIDWSDLRLGISECARRGLITVEYDGDDQVLVKTTDQSRLLRFVWRGVRGQRETFDEARRLADSDDPPIAFVGSGNTALTVELATALREAADVTPEPAHLPILMIPWATAVLADRHGGGSEKTPLLGVHSGRTFRFCPNNQRQAEMVVRCLMQSEPSSPPTRVVMVVDSHDPYSVDLAACFDRAIHAVAPRAKVERQANLESLAGLTDVPGPPERAWAETEWRRAHDGGAAQVTWVVLPLQAEPSKRLLKALRAQVRETSDKENVPIRVLCGDAIGVDALWPMVGSSVIPVWTASPASTPAAPGLGLAHDVQVPGEMVSALVKCIDRSDSDLRQGLLELNIPPSDRSAFGRAIAFEHSGERRGSDLGLVLAVRPGRPEVLAITRGPNGTWNPPVPLAPPIEVVR
jgi:hypothetical protein